MKSVISLLYNIYIFSGNILTHVYLITQNIYNADNEEEQNKLKKRLHENDDTNVPPLPKSKYCLYSKCIPINQFVTVYIIAIIFKSFRKEKEEKNKCGSGRR